MNQHFEEIALALDRAGITMTEASQLFPVSRQTLHNWKGGGAIRNRHLYNLTLYKARLINKAVDMKLLPLPEDSDRSKRVSLVEMAVKEVRRAGKAQEQ